MSIEVLQSIKEAEQKAEELLRGAVTQGREQVKEAEEEAGSLKEETIRKAREEAKAIIADAEEAARKEIQGLNKTNEAEGQVLRKGALSRMEVAKSLIMGRIVSSHGSH